MKTICMLRDFDHKVRPRGGSLVIVAYQEGLVYKRVPEAAVKKIVAVGAGEVVDE